MVAKSSTTRTPNPGNAQPIRAPRAPGAGADDAADPGESMASIAACSSVAGVGGALVFRGPCFSGVAPRGGGGEGAGRPRLPVGGGVPLHLEEAGRTLVLRI